RNAACGYPRNSGKAGRAPGICKCFPGNLGWRHGAVLCRLEGWRMAPAVRMAATIRLFRVADEGAGMVRTPRNTRHHLEPLRPRKPAAALCCGRCAEVACEAVRIGYGNLFRRLGRRNFRGLAARACGPIRRSQILGNLCRHAARLPMARRESNSVRSPQSPRVLENISSLGVLARVAVLPA